MRYLPLADIFCSQGNQMHRGLYSHLETRALDQSNKCWSDPAGRLGSDGNSDFLAVFRDGPDWDLLENLVV